MNMRNFQPDYRHAYSQAGNGFLDCGCNFIGELHQSQIGFFVQIKDFIDFFFWNNQNMAFHQWECIQNCDVVFIFRNFERWNFVLNYFRENTGHDLI